MSRAKHDVRLAHVIASLICCAAPAAAAQIAPRQFYGANVRDGWARQAMAAICAAGWADAMVLTHMRRDFTRYEVAVWARDACRRRANPAPFSPDSGRPWREARAWVALGRIATGFREELTVIGWSNPRLGNGSANSEPAGAMPFLRPIPETCLSAARRLQQRGFIDRRPPLVDPAATGAAEDRTVALRFRLTMALERLLRLASGAPRYPQKPPPPRLKPEDRADISILKAELVEDLRIAHEDWDAWCGMDRDGFTRSRTPALSAAIVRGDAAEVRYLLDVVGVPADVKDDEEGVPVIEVAEKLHRTKSVRILRARLTAKVQESR